MKITRLSIWALTLTSHETYYMADGKICDALASIILRLDSDTGLSGWGEVCPIPHYLPSYAEGVRPGLEHLAPLLLGRDPCETDALMTEINHYLQGHVYVKSIIDIALMDLFGKIVNQPLYRLLGGSFHKALPLYHSITCIAPEEMARIAAVEYGKGMRQFQVKLGADQNNEADIARLKLVREAVGKGPLVYGDWNCGATSLDATRVGRAVADCDIMLEQPCATIAECQLVREATGLAMKLDETAHDFATLSEGRERRCMDAVALKLSKFGGINELRRARDLCGKWGVKMCIEDCWGGDIVTNAALHVAASTNPKYLLNVCDLSGYVSPKLDKSLKGREKGFITVGDGPGLGVTPDEALLGKPLQILEE